MRCDLCNGELEIVAGGKAVCSFCNTTYSAERLQEKLGNLSVQNDVGSKSNKEIESKLRLAERSVYSDRGKAIKLCEDVLEIEPENADAWTIKIEAEFSDVFSMHRGMESFRQACSLIEDDAARQSFIERNSSVILKTPLFNEDLIRPVLSADRDFAEKYLSMALKDRLGKTQESCRKQNDDIESRLRRGMDLMETSYFAKGWNRTATYLKELFDLIITVSAKNWNDESIYINMKKIVELEHATVKNVLKILDTRNDLKSLCNTAEFICNNINDKFAQRYWATHADEKKQLDAKVVELNSQIQMLEKSMSTLPVLAEYNSLEEQIDDTKTELSGKALFAFSEKKTLKAKIKALEADFEQVKQRREDEENKLSQKITGLKKERTRVSNKLKNPIK